MNKVLVVAKEYPEYYNKELHEIELSNYFIITESDVFFDGQLDEAIKYWGNDFIYWTDGVKY